MEYSYQPYQQNASSDTVQLKISTTRLENDWCDFEVQWTNYLYNTNGLIIMITQAEVDVSNSVLWLMNNKSRWKGRIHAGVMQFTAYGLKTDDQQQFQIVSSDQTFMNISASVTDSEKILVLRRHDSSRSILNLWKSVSVPFELSMDTSKSHLNFTCTAASDSKGLLLCQQQPFEERIMIKDTPLGSMKSINLEPILPSRKQLKLRVLILSKEHNVLYHTLKSSTILSTKTYLSKSDVQTLMDMALKYRKTKRPQKVLLPNFFRNRWTSYFHDIMYTNGGLMQKYRKDANGDPDSAINNGNLNGLFFSPALDIRTHKPPTASYFGEKRLHIPANILFCENSHLYFADFYCHYKAHYITLVLTKSGSEEDEFCQKRLIPLDPTNNPFLTREPIVTFSWDYTRCRLVQQLTAEVYTTLCDQVHIEVLYTEDVNIRKLQNLYGADKVYIEDCDILGRGRSLPSGIPKNSNCRHCNLPRPDSQLSDQFSTLHL